MLIAAASGRALAASASRAGYVPLVADRFGDQDTLAVVACHVPVDPSPAADGDAWMAALDSLAAGRDCIGVVCGSGFEDRADLLAQIAQRWRLFGNNAQTIAAIKDPLTFAGICRAVRIPHPETSLAPPDDVSGWLIKRIGGAGGWHVRPAVGGAKTGKGIYFQRHVAGTPISALVLGDGRRLIPLGFSAQWAAPIPRHPFRYGGAVRPAIFDDGVKEAMLAALERLNSAVPLVGLNGADFLVDGQAFHLLEINPRPGATFDLFEEDGTSLFDLHVAACSGQLPAQAPKLKGAKAGAIVYADHDIHAVPPLAWPDWTTDRPVAGSRVRKHQPLCSVLAVAATQDEARHLVDRRGTAVHALLGGSVT